MTDEDLIYWQQFISSIKPLNLKKGSEKVKPVLKERLKIKPRPEKQISYILDLHGFTLQEAYDSVLKFINIHYALSSKSILIITGKGLTGEGKIKKEISNWLETNKLKEKILKFQMENDGGAFRIHLKKTKETKKCQMRK